jgi:hypothetical protein
VGYALVFWRDELTGRDPAEIYNHLMEGIHVPGLSVIPTDMIVSRIASAFSEGVEDDPAGFALCWLSDDATSSFQVEISSQHVHVELRPLVHDTANIIIDIANEYHCPLYDPQTNERFSPEPSHD